MMLLVSQAESLKHYQAVNGEWHTLINDPESYTEISATAEFGYGLLKGLRLRMLNEDYWKCARKALQTVIRQIDDNGVVHKVSYGTAMGNDLDFFHKIPITPMPYGQALALLLLCEGSLAAEKY